MKRRTCSLIAMGLMVIAVDGKGQEVLAAFATPAALAPDTAAAEHLQVVSATELAAIPKADPGAAEIVSPPGERIALRSANPESKVVVLAAKPAPKPAPPTTMPVTGMAAVNAEVVNLDAIHAAALNPAPALAAQPALAAAPEAPKTVVRVMAETPPQPQAQPKPEVQTQAQVQVVRSEPAPVIRMTYRPAITEKRSWDYDSMNDQVFGCGSGG